MRLWRKNPPGDVWYRHLERCNERGVAILGDQCRNTFLYHWHGGWPAPLSANGARLSISHRHEAREQIIEAEGRLPDKIVACIGGGSNAMGCFIRFWMIKTLKFMVLKRWQRHPKRLHAASLTGGQPGILHGNRTYLLQNDDGQITDAHSISAGLDYPGIGLNIHGCTIPAGSIMSAPPMMKPWSLFSLCARQEGIIPPRTIACACLCQHHDW